MILRVIGLFVVIFFLLSAKPSLLVMEGFIIVWLGYLGDAGMALQLSPRSHQDNSRIGLVLSGFWQKGVERGTDGESEKKERRGTENK